MSKANGIKLICDKYNIANNEVICVGNDYNDLDMLNYFANSYLVSNAPAELTKMFALVPSNDNDGFTVAINQALQFKS